jgi:hypothetical protein
MLPPNSSTFSSEPPQSAAASARFVTGGFSLQKFLRTTGFFMVFLALFEVGTWSIFTYTPLRNGTIHQYLDYGRSYEWKLRKLVDTPNLPPNSVLYAGWLGDGTLQSLPHESDLTIYGMSFTQRLGRAIEELRPQLSQRSIGGPGAPLSHTYAVYQVDKKLRKTRFVVIGVTSGAVEEVVLMNRGTLYSDPPPKPYFFPRYRLDHGKVVLAAQSLINSADELRTALGSPELWERQLEILAANDSAYHRFFFAADLLDNSVIARFVRRGMSKRAMEAYSTHVLGPEGFRRDQEAPQLFRALLRQMVREVRAEPAKPIVVLFSLQGQGNHLYSLVEDILREDAVPFVNTNDFCLSSDNGVYISGDMHFTPSCDLQFARRTLELIDAADRPAAQGQ